MANKNVNDSKIKTHILTKKVQLIVDTDRFDTDEDVKNGVGRVSQDEFICKDPNCPSHTLYTRGPKGHKVPYFNADRNASRNIAMSEDFVKKNAKDNAFKKIDDLYEINNDIDAA